MARRERVRYTLSDLSELAPLPDREIRVILRAADEIIAAAGRTMLAKILKGSKDAKLLEVGLDKCPSYGEYHTLTMEEISKRIDWMIVHDYLDIEYQGRLPMIVFSYQGWERYKPQYADELLDLILTVNEETGLALVERLKKTNREVVILILDEIVEHEHVEAVWFLRIWEMTEVKKVRAMINAAITKLVGS